MAGLVPESSLHNFTHSEFQVINMYKEFVSIAFASPSCACHHNLCLPHNLSSAFLSTPSCCQWETQPSTSLSLTLKGLSLRCFFCCCKHNYVRTWHEGICNQNENNQEHLKFNPFCPWFNVDTSVVWSLSKVFLFDYKRFVSSNLNGNIF